MHVVNKMSFHEQSCQNGSFLDREYNGILNGVIVGPSFYNNPLTKIQRVSFGILFFFLAIMSLVGNGLALLTVYKRRLQILYKCCVVSQNIADFLMALFVGINSINNFIHDTVDWTLGSFMCSFIPFVTTMSALMSSMILTTIAIDRYQGVVLLSGKWDPKLSTGLFIIGGLWLAAAGTTIPTYLGYSEIQACFIDFEKETSMFAHLCVANNKISRYYFFIIFTIIFLPLLIAFIVLYGSIARMMWLRRRADKSIQGSVSASTLDTNIETQVTQDSGQIKAQTTLKSTRSQSQKKVRIFSIILIIMATFIILRLPQWIFIVVTMLPHQRFSGNIWWVVKYLLSSLTLANTALNPFIYSFLNETMNLKSNLASGLKYLKNFKSKNIRMNLVPSKGK